MKTESVVSPLAPGAARYIDFSWPVPELYFGATTRPLFSRIANSNASTMQWAVSQGAGSTFNYLLRNNVPAVQLVSGNVINAGFSLRLLDPAQVAAFGIVPRLGRSGIVSSCDDFTCYRIYANMCWQAIPAADCDYGYELVFPPVGGEQLMFLNNPPGIGFVRRASGVVALVVNSNAGVKTFFPVQAPTFPAFDPTVFHTYELRIIGAGLATDAQCFALVDGVPLASLSWADPSMPTYALAFPQAQLSLCAYADGVGKTLALRRVRVCASQSIIGTL